MDDPEFTSDLVKLLFQELKVVRAQLCEAEGISSATPSAGGSDRQALIAENDSLKVDNAALQQIVARLQDEARQSSTIKSEENAEMLTSHTSEEFSKLLAANRDLIREKEEALQKEEQLSVVRDKYKRAKAKVHEYYEVLSGLRDAFLNSTQELERSRKAAVSEIDFRDFLNDVHSKLEVQLQLSSIPPYTHRGTKLPKKVKDLCNGPYFINTDEVIWSPSGIAHGLVIMPTYQYNPKTSGGTWTKLADNFEIGKLMDVCCLSGDTARYLGTYERTEQGKMVIAPEVLKHLSQQKLTFVSQRTTLFPDLVPPSQTRMIRNMYIQGVIKMQCFGIRLVAYNQNFVEKLQEMGASSVQSKPLDNTASGNVQKRKRDPKSTAHSNKNKKRYGPFADESNNPL